jgi:hypothetical protein
MPSRLAFSDKEWRLIPDMIDADKLRLDYMRCANRPQDEKISENMEGRNNQA